MVQDKRSNGGYALVTAGGTTVPIDGMRAITNRSEGDFGVAIANALAERGVKVVLFISRFGFFKHQDRIGSYVTVVSYCTFDEYVGGIDRILAEHGQPAYAFSAAAVSDYGPEQTTEGKISSSEPKLTLTLVPLPKVLGTWHEKFGRKCRIVGFKFLSTATSSQADLFLAAWNQNTKGDLDLTVANFQEELGGGMHPVWLVNPNGCVRRIAGRRQDVAAQIADHVLSGGEGVEFETPETWSPVPVRRSATIRLRASRTNHVLLMRRSSASYTGMWSNFGGVEEPQDLGDPWNTGTRETYEESGGKIDLRGSPRPGEPVVSYATTVVKKGGKSELRINRIDCFPVDVEDELETGVSEGEGSEARWLDPETARALPMGPATRAVLQMTWPGFTEA